MASTSRPRRCLSVSTWQGGGGGEAKRTREERCHILHFALTEVIGMFELGCSPGCPLFGLQLRLVAVGHGAGQETAPAAHGHRLLEAQRAVARLHARHVSRGRVRHAGRDRHVRAGYVCSVGRRGVQLGEVYVGRLELQGGGLVRGRRQLSAAPPRHQYRVAVLMGVMPMIVLMRMSWLTAPYRAGTPRALLQAGRPVVAPAFDVTNRTRRPRRARRRAPRT